ncbi:hypothetical protein GCM10022230_15620 [Pseudoclavibacter caeni]
MPDGLFEQRCTVQHLNPVLVGDGVAPQVATARTDEGQHGIAEGQKVAHDYRVLGLGAASRWGG